jgi:hypothetical protein
MTTQTPAEAVRAGREAFLPSPSLDPSWIAGWHAATDHHVHVLQKVETLDFQRVVEERNVLEGGMRVLATENAALMTRAHDYAVAIEGIDVIRQEMEDDDSYLSHLYAERLDEIVKSVKQVTV